MPDVSRFVPPDDQARLIRDVGPRCVTIVPGVGHSVHRDALERFVAIVTAMAT
jgi:pimeloyl-ACP methyl ester carboxylesterase